MKNIAKQVSAGIFSVVAFAIMLVFANKTNSAMVRNLGAETDYSIVLNNASAPPGLTNTPSDASSYIGPKNISFSYNQVTANSGGLVTLDAMYSSSFGNLDQITTITEFNIVYTGFCQIWLSWDYGMYDESYTHGTTLQSGVTYQTAEDYYFFNLLAASGIVTIESVTITYSCTPTPPAPVYTLAADGLSYIVNGVSKRPYDLVIPSIHNGLPVTEIAPNAFMGSPTLETVYIPDSVTKIGVFAFSASSNLYDVRLPSGLTILPDQVFSGCGALSEITLPSTLVSIGTYAFDSSGISVISIPSSVTTIGEGAFMATSRLIDFTFIEPINVTHIPVSMFEGSSILSITLPEGIVSIGANAFASSELEDITFPSTLTTIGDFAFNYTYSFSTMLGTLSNITNIGAYAFEYSRWQDDQLMSSQLIVFDGRVVVEAREVDGDVVLAEGITHIADFAFYDNDLISSVTLPSTMIAIGRDAFTGDEQLLEVDTTAATNLLRIADYGFSSCINLADFSFPSSVIDVGDDAFFNTSFLSSKYISGLPFIVNDRIVIIGHSSGAITLPSTITRINSQAYGGSDIESIILPEGLLYIGPTAFIGCSNLTTISLPNSVIRLGEAAFMDSTLESIVIGNSVTAIEPYTFSGNMALTSVTLPNNLLIIDEAAFFNCATLPSITLPSTLTNINLSAFSACSALNQISIPGSVTYIGQAAFAMTGLTSVVINEGVVSISDYAFQDNALLTSVTLPNSLREIGNTAFEGCETLPSIIIPANVSFIGSDAFLNCLVLNIYARAVSLPSTWDLSWNTSERPVTWNYLL